MGRYFLISLFVLSTLLLVQRERFNQRVTTFEPAQQPSHVNSEVVTDKNNYYKTGKYDIQAAPVPVWSTSNPLGFLDLLGRKKINGFMFTQYNLYKLEINFVDLGYSSLVQVYFWTKDLGSVKFQQKVGFSLHQDFNTPSLNLDVQKKEFYLQVRQVQRVGRDGKTQTVTSFNLSTAQSGNQIEANYTHIRRDDQCMTAVRQGVISHKCYGGYGYGKIKLNTVFFDESVKQQKQKMSAFNPKANLTRCSFDGFRGNGWGWKWTWIYGAGFSKPQFYSKNQTIEKQRWIGFNFGSLNEKSDDFLFLNGKVYPIQGAEYSFNETFPISTNLTFTAKNPKIDMVFQIMNRNKIYEDFGVLKNDMIRAEGHWAGYLIDPQNGTNEIKFYQISGLIENANSFF